MKTFEKLVLSASFAVLFASGLPALGQTPPPPPQATRAQVESLMTTQERDQYREKMRAAKTPAERVAIRKQIRSTMEERAKAKGLTLPKERSDRRATRKSDKSTRPQLLSKEERQQFRERSRAAKTPEERAEIRKQMRTTIAQRAKEKDVTLSKGKDRRHGAGKPAKKAQLLSTDERRQYRDKMRTAKTPEERTVLRTQMRELTQQRAKEKGITLPQRRTRGESSKGKTTQT